MARRKPRAAAAPARPPTTDELVERVQQIARAAAAGYHVAANGDVYRTTCDCARHTRRGTQYPLHDAKPIGNVHRDAELAARLGLSTKAAAS